jgi:D-Tyr-tRNAtyr deacylase
MKYIPSPLMYEYGSPIMNDENMGKLIDYDFTKLLIITRDNESTFSYLKGKIAELKKFEDLDFESDFTLSFHDADGKTYIIMNLHSIEKFESVLERLKTQKTIAHDNPVMYLDQ